MEYMVLLNCSGGNPMGIVEGGFSGSFLSVRKESSSVSRLPRYLFLLYSA